jgi:hypothetical protein
LVQEGWFARPIDISYEPPIVPSVCVVVVPPFSLVTIEVGPLEDISAQVVVGATFALVEVSVGPLSAQNARVVVGSPFPVVVVTVGLVTNECC